MQKNNFNIDYAQKDIVFITYAKQIASENASENLIQIGFVGVI